MAEARRSEEQVASAEQQTDGDTSSQSRPEKSRDNMGVHERRRLHLHHDITPEDIEHASISEENLFDALN